MELKVWSWFWVDVDHQQHLPVLSLHINICQPLLYSASPVQAPVLLHPSFPLFNLL